MLKIKEGIPLRILLHYGFEYDERGFYCYTRIIDDVVAWKLYSTKNHNYLQIKVYEPCTMAGALQSVLYDLIKDGLVEKVEG
jgi:hypothetical protein